MTLIRISDIRHADVTENAGLSNIPWEVKYGFQRQGEVADDQTSILDEMYNYGALTEEESVLDGLSPDIDGTFTTTAEVTREGKKMWVQYGRERLIEDANVLLREAAEAMSVAIQREYLHPGPHLTMCYELCPARGTMSCIVIGNDVFPLSQILDLRGYSVTGKLEWVDADPVCSDEDG